MSVGHGISQTTDSKVVNQPCGFYRGRKVEWYKKPASSTRDFQFLVSKPPNNQYSPSQPPTMTDFLRKYNLSILAIPAYYTLSFVPHLCDRCRIE
jgi:hypothetical protein